MSTLLKSRKNLQIYYHGQKFIFKRYWFRCIRVCSLRPLVCSFTNSQFLVITSCTTNGRAKFFSPSVHFGDGCQLTFIARERQIPTTVFFFLILSLHLQSSETLGFTIMLPSANLVGFPFWFCFQRSALRASLPRDIYLSCEWVVIRRSSIKYQTLIGLIF